MPDVVGLLYGVARDEDGNALSQAEIRLYEPGTTTLVLLYADRGTHHSLPLTAPYLADKRGVYSFGVYPGVYDLRITGRGSFDKTFPGTYVDQVDWSWGRECSIFLNMEEETNFGESDPSIWNSNDLIVSPLWPRDRNRQIIWAGDAVADGGEGIEGKARVTYVGTDTKVFKAGFLSNPWADTLSDIDETFIFEIRKNGSTVLLRVPVMFSSLIEPTAGGVSDSPAPVVAYGEVLVELVTDDTVEIWVWASGAPPVVDAWIENFTFWVTL